MSVVVHPDDITCPRCTMAGPCREAGSWKASPHCKSVRTHHARVERAKALTRANELAELLGFEDGVPEFSEVEMLAKLGHEDDQPLARELIKVCRAANVLGFEEA